MVTFEGLPGAVAVSHLRVYDWPTEDGLRGGTPHLHLTCSEGYVVVGGAGSVQTLTASGFRQTALAAGSLVWFTPGTIHRLVNDDALRIVVLMQNSGLPEAGDAVLTLPPRYLTDTDTYRAAAALPPTRQSRNRNAPSAPAAIWPSRAFSRCAAPPRPATPSRSPPSTGRPPRS